jgi:hypothetical protein
MKSLGAPAVLHSSERCKQLLKGACSTTEVSPGAGAMKVHNQERLRRIKLALDDYRGGDDHLPLGD